MRDLKDNNVLMIFPSVAAAFGWLRLNGWPRANDSAICACTKGKQAYAYGHNWSYVDQSADLHMEEWKLIPPGVLRSGEDSGHMASTLGRIKNRHGQVFDGCHEASGYVTFAGKPLNRIIAFTFLENDDPANKIKVKHLNNNPLDNRVDNLMWDTHSQNILEAYQDGLVNNTNCCQKVRVINTDTNEVVVYDKTKDVHKAYNVGKDTIQNRLNDGKVLRNTPYRFERV